MPPTDLSVEPMAPIDQLFFRGERDAARRPTALAVYLLDRAPEWSELQYTFERVSREHARLRQRVVEPTAGVGPAHWVIDPDFDLAYHLRRLRVPTEEQTRRTLDAPDGGPTPADPFEIEAIGAKTHATPVVDALLPLLEPELMTPLDVTRPLWEATLVEGLPGDSAAIVFKTSHAVSDGIGGMQLNELLFEEKRDAGRRAMPLAPLPEDLTSDELALENLRTIGRVTSGGIRKRVGDAFETGRRWLADPRGISDWVESLRRTLGPPAEPSVLLAGRGLKRRAIALDVPLRDFKAAARHLGGSINDAYLAALAGALGRYHAALGTSVETVPMAIPINTRRDGDEVGGNHFAGAMLAAPVGEPDLVARMCAIRKSVRSARDEPALGATDELARLLVALPQEVTNRLGENVPAPDIQASNVPGPRVPVYLAGASVERMIGFGPLPGVALMVVMLSYRDVCSIGVNYDPAAIDAPQLLERCLHEAFDEVLALSTIGPPAATEAAHS